MRAISRFRRARNRFEPRPELRRRRDEAHRLRAGVPLDPFREQYR